MSKLKFLKIFFILLSFSSLTWAKSIDTQTVPLTITTKLIKQLRQLKPDTSNAYEVEQILGKPAACVPLWPINESWMCQWKADVNQARIDNTLNIMFSAGMITRVIGIDKNGKEF